MKEIEKTIALEGGWVFDLDDPGGETKYGISKKSYPLLDIKNLSKQDAEEIYKKDYFDALQLYQCKYVRIRWKVFDIAVNMGISAARRMISELLTKNGYIVDDDNFGTAIETFTTFSHEDWAMLAIVERQVKRYVDIVNNRPASIKFLKGWISRAFDTGEDLEE